MTDIFPGPTATMQEVVDAHVLRALIHFEGKKGATASSLGIDPKTLLNRLKVIEARARRVAAALAAKVGT